MILFYGNQPLRSANFRLSLRDSSGLFYLFDDEHFDGHIRRNEFEAELVEQGLFQVIKIRMPIIGFIPMEINVKTIGESGLINDGNLKTIF